MKSILYFIIRFFLGATTFFITWPIALFGFDQGFWISGLYALLAGTGVFYLLKNIMFRQLIRQNGLTRREYKLVDQNLSEAKKKINRLQKAFLKVQSLPSAKKNFETLRVVYRIYNITKKEPRRFFLAEEFYYSHLDSLVEITEKYTFLASQPSKTPELTKSLHDTKHTLDDMVRVIEKDLHHLVETDINNLNFEIDVAKKSINRKK
jgi:5-bromo-4-chloroindolyl phosphate hydrolysis protein